MFILNPGVSNIVQKKKLMGIAYRYMKLGPYILHYVTYIMHIGVKRELEAECVNGAHHVT